MSSSGADVLNFMKNIAIDADSYNHVHVTSGRRGILQQTLARLTNVIHPEPGHITESASKFKIF
ncbi:hypothetical protein PAAG_12514 [Paracoccidioides lutzii Pb01]|uniref:Uncharacterized protein n=1 Tax=Paracoccidioides lutzii (strain ATCC MYA-826 / Pb01) TaxID=502779 RepID=A0A0A2VIR9_PARBA|nr:hypothetical protein PAAG_12514 [Paracoccidioides lutzii Pb01]KGQ00819.1 hypothetical protein PAAG_12514 [Paracoccidioides lutzii Pb01]